MLNDYFIQRKNSILQKKDKSFKGSIDKKISKLCNRINKKNKYYTSSSCSGRIILILDKEKKQPNLILKSYHEKISLKQIKKDLKEIIKKGYKNIKYKQEPAILHISCKRLEDAIEILKKAKETGWKKSGILSIGKTVTLEISSTEKIEFPIINNKKIIVNDNFLKTVIKISNKNLEKNWDKIKKLQKII